jgi:hypothetical protein
MLQDSISIITANWQALSASLLIIATSYVLIVSILKTIFQELFTRSDYFSLGLAGWLLPASLLALLSFLGKSEIATRLIPILLPVLCISSIVFLLRLKPDPSTGLGQRLKPAPQPIDFFLPLFLAFTIPLRLIFIKDLVLPSYFDSVEHYARIQNILNLQTASPFMSQVYYHIGYHILAAFVVTASQAPIGATMLIIGQLLLAIMPISVFFLIRQSTGSVSAGMFSVILAAFGWYMPAHVVNWGKYPALMSLGLIPFVISLAYLRAQYRDRKTVRRHALTGIILASIFISTIIHSRSLVIYGLIAIAWFSAHWIEKLPARPKTSALILTGLGIVFEIVTIQRQELLKLLFDPYLNAGIVITSIVLLSALFAWRAHSQLATTSLLTILFLCGSVFIPLKGLWGYPDLTLLDRPFAEMILFLPLTILGGLGLAGMRSLNVRGYSFHTWVGIALIGAVFVHAFKTYRPDPSPCCIIVSQDDVAAIAWMNIHIPQDAKIGVAATAMDVIVSDAFEGLSGSDAGIWIAPLINRVTIHLINTSDFDQASTLDMICKFGIDFLYVGARGQTFDRNALHNHPEWYTPQLTMPAAQVYAVKGCAH